jgi:hypothetical protein
MRRMLKPGRSLFAAAVAAGALAALPGCGSSSDCIILANGGNKLCGDDAAAWCDSTDAGRNAVSGLGSSEVDASMRDSQDACDSIRGQ